MPSEVTFSDVFAQQPPPPPPCTETAPSCGLCETKSNCAGSCTGSGFRFPSCPTPGPCDGPTTVSNRCGQSKPCSAGPDYYTCGKCGQSGAPPECNGFDVRSASVISQGSKSCCTIGCNYVPYWKVDSAGCSQCGGGTYTSSGEGFGFGDYAGGVPGTNSLGEVGCCGDDPGELVNTHESACSITDVLDPADLDPAIHQIVQTVNPNLGDYNTFGSHTCGVESEIYICEDLIPDSDDDLHACYEYTFCQVVGVLFGQTTSGFLCHNSDKWPRRSGPSSVCCETDDHAVQGGLCLPPTGPYPTVGTPGSYSIDKVWHDCDDSYRICTSLCNLEWLQGGEYDNPSNPLASNLGEYDYNPRFASWPFECCEDDDNEFTQSRRTGCLGGTDHCDRSKYPNNWPDFDPKASDRVCCSDEDDAVYEGRCFEDKKDPPDPADLVGGPYHFDGTLVKVADATNVPNLVANKNVWYDCDSDEATCTGNRADGLCGFNWTKNGEYPKGPGVYPSNQLPSLVQCIGEHAQLDTTWSSPADDSRVINECCGDDPVEVYVNSSQGLPNALNPTGKYEACCNVETDCVDYDGTCVTTCEFAESTNPNYPAVNKPFYCVLNNWWPKLYGTVTDVNGDPIDGVLVTAVGAYHDSVKHGEQLTENNGNYVVYIPNSTYDVIASKPQEGYEDTIFFSVPIHEPTELNFVLRRPSTDCNDDCTRSDGLCHADCDGKELCDFPDDPDSLRNLDLAKECDLSAPGVIRLSDNQRFFQCCTGGISRQPYYRIPTDVKVCGENVVSSVRPVLLEGQLVNMIVTVFQQPSGPCT